MSAPTRWVIVDDTNPNILYEGHSWFPDVGSLDNIGDYGPPYRNTLHGTNDTSSLSYQFSGTRVRALGTNSIRNDSGHIDPQWECFVDNVSIGSAPAFQYPENNWLLCPETLLKGQTPHTLTIKATVTTGRTFWFDRIDYVPPPSQSLEDKAILVTHNDSSLQFDSGWKSYGGYAQGTSTEGSIFLFNFYGVSLAWYGYTPKEFPASSSLATWQIDDQPPKNFTIPGYSDQNPPGYNRKFFETMSLPSGPHRLLVTHKGNTETTPLNLVYLVVQNGTACATSTRSGSAPNGVCPTPTSSRKPSSAGPGEMSNATNLGAIIGGVVSAVVILAFAIFIIVFLLRRRRHPIRRKTKDVFDPDLFVDIPNPRLPNATFRFPNHRRRTQSLFRQFSVQRSTSKIHSDRQENSSIETSHQIERQPMGNNEKVPLVRLSNPDDTGVRGMGFDVPSEVPRVVIHQDSGVRLHQQRPEQTLINVPPQYTQR